MTIVIQHEDFDLYQEYQALRADAPQIGAIVTFCGLVRDFAEGQGESLFIEHFPGMAETTLADIVTQAQQRWPIINVRIIHRIGELSLGEQIVFVGVNSAHRKAALNACDFIMDFLKTQAPFWKKAKSQRQHCWVEAKSTDTDAQRQWLKK